MSGGQARGVLAFQRVRQVQPLAFLVRVEHQQADVGTAFRICHTQDLPALEDKREVSPAGKRLFT